jgi:hypothetical protein
MCYRIHDLDHQREKAAQHTPTTSSLHAWTGERLAAFMAWLRPSAKAAVPVASTSPPQPKPAEAAAKSAPLDQASTRPSTSAEVREREAEMV